MTTVKTAENKTIEIPVSVYTVLVQFKLMIEWIVKGRACGTVGSIHDINGDRVAIYRDSKDQMTFIEVITDEQRIVYRVCSEDDGVAMQELDKLSSLRAAAEYLAEAAHKLGMSIEEVASKNSMFIALAENKLYQLNKS